MHRWTTWGSTGRVRSSRFLTARGFDSLPHVKVYGADGTLALEAGGTVEDVIAQVRRAAAR